MLAKRLVSGLRVPVSRSRVLQKTTFLAGSIVIATMAMSQTAFGAGLTPSASTAMLGAGSMPLTLVSSVPAANGLVTTKWTGRGGVTDTVNALPGSTVSIVPTTVDGRTGYAATVAPPTSSASAGTQVPSSVSTASTTCYNGDNGLSIAKGCIYNSGNSSVCDPNTCLTYGWEQKMIQNVPGDVITGQQISATVSNNGYNSARYAEAYTDWPGSSGDTWIDFRPQYITTTQSGTQNVTWSLSDGPFSFSQNFYLGSYATYGYVWPHTSANPAFGAAWSGDNTAGTPVSSADTMRIGTGQSDLCSLTGVVD